MDEGDEQGFVVDELTTVRLLERFPASISAGHNKKIRTHLAIKPITPPRRQLKKMS